MSHLLERVRNVDGNNSEEVKEALSAFFQHLGKNVNVNNTIWLKAVENVINRFPKYCMSHRSTIEEYLIQFLDSSHYFLVIESAKCAHALQQVRPSQEKTATAKSCWKQQMMSLCSAAHCLIGAIFPNAIDIYRSGGYFQVVEQHLSSPETPLSIVLCNITSFKNLSDVRVSEDKQAALCTRLQNVLIFIQAMLVEHLGNGILYTKEVYRQNAFEDLPDYGMNEDSWLMRGRIQSRHIREIYPVAKPICPQPVLDLIVRVLSVSSSGDIMNAEGDIANIKIQALRTLDALVFSLGSNLIPFSPLVFRLAMQTLRWSAGHSNEESRTVRCQAYNSLANWLTTLHCHKPDPGNNGKGKCFEDELITNIIQDVTPHRHIIQLTMSSRPTKNLSKKAKRKLANTMLMESNLATYTPGDHNTTIGPHKNDEVAIAALECAELFLIVCGTFLKLATHKLLQERLVHECFNIEQYSQQRGLALCRAMEAARKSVPPGVPPPTQYCLQLYSLLTNSSDREISKLCSQALHDTRLHLHCSPPSLNFNKERNRAALKLLLGSDRFSTNEVIINDEPSSKKARLEDDASDKISISSQSSIEISDDSDEICVNEEQTIHNLPTQNVTTNNNKESGSDDTSSDTSISEHNAVTLLDIHEVRTQIPANVSNDTIDAAEISPPSAEVTYDYPNTNSGKITDLEKIDGENLPCTNETDDDQITCGQGIVSSQEVTPQKGPNLDEIELPPTLDGINNVEDPISEVNGERKQEIDTITVVPVNNAQGVVTESNLSVTITTNNEEGMTEENMLADFVDEVNAEVIKYV